MTDTVISLFPPWALCVFVQRNHSPVPSWAGNSHYHLGTVISSSGTVIISREQLLPEN